MNLIKTQIVTAVRSGNTKLLNQSVLLLEAQFSDKQVDKQTDISLKTYLSVASVMSSSWEFLL